MSLGGCSPTLPAESFESLVKIALEEDRLNEEGRSSYKQSGGSVVTFRMCCVGLVLRPEAG